MRRTDREIKDKQELRKIVEDCRICRIAMQDEEGLYLVPVTFGYSYEKDQLCLYVHSAKEGRKIEALKKNPKVCFEMDCDCQLVEAENACGYGCTYRSIIGTGTARFLEDTEEKKRALRLLMRHQTGKEFAFTDAMASCVTVFEIAADSFTGKGRSL